MSRRVSTGIPLLDKECIVESLTRLHYAFVMHGDSILITNVLYGGAKLIYDKDHYVLEANEHEINQIKQRITTQYTEIYNDKLHRIEEAERQRLEEERMRYVANQKAAVIEKAKKLGYSVKESVENEKVTLVLVKRVY